MTEYHKIQTVWLRDPATKHRALLEGQWAKPEFAYLRNNGWVFTEKVDGTNIRVLWDGECIEFRGKTDNAQIPPFLLRFLENYFCGMGDMFADIFPDGACLYGEGYGAKIQKGGGNYRSDQGFVLFDVRVGPWWLQRKDVDDVGDKLDCDVVPIVSTGTLHDMVRIVRDGFKSYWGDFAAEGLVARPAVELYDRAGKRIITKLKCKDFAATRSDAA